jgi:flagellar hook-associated protein 2
MDLLPSGLTTGDYKNAKLEITGSDGTKYVEGTDFQRSTYTNASGTTYSVIEWLSSNKPADGATYTVRGVIEDDYGANSVLAQLGFITAAADGFPVNQWTFTEGSYTNASSAEFEVDGVPITRDTNTIEGLITDVTLELKGLGQVRINIVRDLEETVENMQSFVDAYNTVMEWINFYISEKGDGANPVDETDYLSSLLSESVGNTVFGTLYGDQLLSSIKNQLRSRISNPITTLASSLASRKVAQTTEALNIKSAFYIYTNGKASRIDIDPADSLADIQRKLSTAQNWTAQKVSSASDSSYFNLAATGGDLGLEVAIRDGQIVIEGPTSTGSILDTLTRSTAASYDYLSFIPITSSPIDGAVSIYSGSTVYEEGIDYKITTEVSKDADGNDMMSACVEWLNGGKRPTSTYNVEYTYNAGAVSYSEISGSGPTTSDLSKGINDLSYLDLHLDSSKLSLASVGITTESTDYGKSGLLEFDSEAFLSMMESDPDIVGNALLSFMRDFDTYIGNLVDSSQTLVAGQIVTKGRIATALNTIDSEQTTLNDRITKLNTQLEEKQTALYKQYSDMEVAIQKLNAQMSSLSSYLANMSS